MFSLVTELNMRICGKSVRDSVFGKASACPLYLYLASSQTYQCTIRPPLLCASLPRRRGKRLLPSTSFSRVATAARPVYLIVTTSLPRQE